MEDKKQCTLTFKDWCKKKEKEDDVLNTGYINKYNEIYFNKDGKHNIYENINERPIIDIQGDQPVFNVPVYQDKYIRDKIVECVNYEIQDVVQPTFYSQETKHDVPTVELLYKEKKVNIPQEKIIEKPVEVDMPIGYTPVFSPTWDVREIPRVIPKYEGEQKIIQVEIPQIKYVDKFVEKEIIVDIKEKIIPRINEVEKEIDVVKYQWKEKYQDVPVCKYVPKIDVELDCPPPLIVPYPAVHFHNTSEVLNPHQKALDIPSEMLLKNNNIFSYDTNMNGSNCNIYNDNNIYNDSNIYNYSNIYNDSNIYNNSNMHNNNIYNNSNNYNGMSNFHVDESVKKSLLDVARLTGVQKDNDAQYNEILKNKSLEKKKKKKNWPFCYFKKDNIKEKEEIYNGRNYSTYKNNCCSNYKEENENNYDIDPNTGYPKSMPKDFASFFKQDLDSVKKQMEKKTNTKSSYSSDFLEKSPVNPSIEYLGKVDKPPIDAGKLDSISFKLHAIEVHQFIPVPNLPKPRFLDLVPSHQYEQNDISSLQNVFGQVPEGWVDPQITGFIAPMMNDVLHGNIQPQSPLFNNLSTEGHDSSSKNRRTPCITAPSNIQNNNDSNVFSFDHDNYQNEGGEGSFDQTYYDEYGNDKYDNEENEYNTEYIENNNDEGTNGYIKSPNDLTYNTDSFINEGKQNDDIN
ncbi:inner membrane complex protein 1j, putative [Plasmodium sp. gorilla clade G3]|nr:inner membrane complex protein 1j, putative [Plasmodium sp. gorilla clade G3]